MTCEELASEYAAYALGVAEEPERQEIAAHLARNCPRCVPGVRKALEVVAAMSGAVKMVDPPKRLRGRVLSLVAPGGKERRWVFAFAPWAVSAALAAALLVVALPGRRQPEGAARMERALAILSDPATRDAAFGPPATRGRVFASPGKGVVFIASGLPAIEAHRTFELWVIPAAGKPIPAGTFQGEAGAAVYVSNAPAAGAAAVAVTVEPEGGSPQPTSAPFIVAKL